MEHHITLHLESDAGPFAGMLNNLGLSRLCDQLNEVSAVPAQLTSNKQNTMASLRREKARHSSLEDPTNKDLYSQTALGRKSSVLMKKILR
ncbi:hypothetical protein AMECASPLE_033836 [Ameca splendens]|uniref:Uncharacterized protein n=1 Tax=Ameca splendens TaxID=208324 RepID=A0ABV0Z5A3_9TELE